MKEKERQTRGLVSKIFLGGSLLLLICSLGYSGIGLFSAMDSGDNKMARPLAIGTAGLFFSLAGMMAGTDILYGDSDARQLSQKELDDRLAKMRSLD